MFKSITNTQFAYFFFSGPEALKALNKKDKQPSRPSSAIRRSSSNTAGNLVNGSSASNSPRATSAVTNDTPKRPEKRASAKRVMLRQSVGSLHLVYDLME